MERLVVDLLVTTGGVALTCLVVLIMPVIPAYAWTDIVLIVIKLATLIAALTLALGGGHLTITSLRGLRSPHE